MISYKCWRSMHARITLGVLLFCCILFPLASCSTPTPQSIQFTPLNLGIPQEALKSPVVGNLPGTTVLHVRVTFKMDPNWLNRMQNQPIQPGQRSHLENVANKIGIDDATYQKIKSFFSTQKLAVNLSKLHTHLSVDGKASTFAKLLQTSFVEHKYHGRTFFAPATPPKVPTFLANSIDAVTGLDNYSARPVHDLSFRASVPSTRRQAGQADCSPLDQTLLPRDVADAYGYDQLWNRGLNGENMTVNLVEIDGSYRDDIQNYFNCITFKGHLNVVNVDGRPSDVQGESTLDVQMVAGLARSVNITLYQTDAAAADDIWINVNDELQAILNNNTGNANSGNVVSISLGAAEGEMSLDDARAIGSSIEQLTRVEHMSVFVASGDCGAFSDGVYGQLAVSFPASDPWVTAVGGTILSVNGSHQRTNEVTWSDGSHTSQCKNHWGSGGGNSQMFKEPSWQDAPGVRNRYSRSAKQVPDVSAAAFDLAVYFQGQWGAVGGTSAAAPIWAVGVALTNEGLMRQVHKFGYGPQLFYQAAGHSSDAPAYYDITRGNNLYYPATPGWDFSTGLGTLNLISFYQAVGNSL